MLLPMATAQAPLVPGGMSPVVLSDSLDILITSSPYISYRIDAIDYIVLYCVTVST